MPVWTNIPGNIPGQFNAWRTRASSFPRWGVPMLLIAALPAILVAAAGAFLLGISLLIALLFVIPAYRVIMFMAPRKESPTSLQPDLRGSAPSPGSKPVTVRVLD